MKILKAYVIAGGDTQITRDIERGKLAVYDTDSRPEYVEVDNTHEELVIRFSFSDDAHWSGTMSELKQKLEAK